MRIIAGHLDSAPGAAVQMCACTPFKDGAVRNYQRKTQQWTSGKNVDFTGLIRPICATVENDIESMGVCAYPMPGGAVYERGATAL